LEDLLPAHDTQQECEELQSGAGVADVRLVGFQGGEDFLEPRQLEVAFVRPNVGLQGRFDEGHAPTRQYFARGTNAACCVVHLKRYCNSRKNQI